MPLSSSVVATYLVDDDRLRLLILWRGAPGWFANPGECRSTMPPPSGNNRKRMTVTLTCGGLTLPWSVDLSRHTGRVLEEPVNLESESVVLVDGVGDTATTPRIVKRWWIPQTGVPFRYVIREAISPRPQLFRELRCEQKLDDEVVQQQLDASCRKLRP